MSQSKGNGKGADDSLEDDYVCVGDSTTSYSASTVTCKVVNGSHELRVHGYSILKELRKKRIESPAFGIGGHSWCLELYLNGDSDDEDEDDNDDDSDDAEDDEGESEVDQDIGIFLHCLDNTPDLLKSDPDRVPVFARPRFSVLCQNGKPGFVRDIGWRRFPHGKISAWGEDLISRDGLEESEEYLKEDSFTVRCDVDVVVISTSDKSETKNQ